MSEIEFLPINYDQLQRDRGDLLLGIGLSLLLCLPPIAILGAYYLLHNPNFPKILLGK